MSIYIRVKLIQYFYSCVGGYEMIEQVFQMTLGNERTIEKLVADETVERIVFKAPAPGN